MRRWCIASALTEAGSAERHPAPVEKMRLPKGALWAMLWPTAAAIFVSIVPVTTNTRPGQARSRIVVAWRLGKVWPEWLSTRQICGGGAQARGAGVKQGRRRARACVKGMKDAANQRLG